MLRKGNYRHWQFDFWACRNFLNWSIKLQFFSNLPIFYQLTHIHIFDTLWYLYPTNQKVIQNQTYYLILTCFCEVKLEKVNNFTHARYNFELTHSTYIQKNLSSKSTERRRAHFLWVVGFQCTSGWRYFSKSFITIVLESENASILVEGDWDLFMTIVKPWDSR